jgi:uncharacterized protein YfkK (UPF0435 family)
MLWVEKFISTNQYVFGWEVDKNDTEQLRKYFDMIWKEKPFSIWKKTAINLEDQNEKHNEKGTTDHENRKFIKK